MGSVLGAIADVVRAATGRGVATPVPMSPRLGGMVPMLSGARGASTALGDALTASSTLFAVVDKIAPSLGCVEWRAHRDGDPGLRDDSGTEPTPIDHPALDLIRKPNDHMDKAHVFEACQQHFELVGECALAVAKAPGVALPLELWPVNPARLVPVKDPYAFLLGWMYAGPDGDMVPLRRDEVLRFYRPSPSDPYRGIGAVQAVLVDVEAARFSAEWNLNFFRNSAEPGGFLKFDRRLEDDEFAELAARWSQQHRGVSRAHRVGIIEEGEWVSNSATQRDMQFAELRGVSREVIREAFGVAAFMLGISDSTNRATADAHRAVFAEQVQVPRLERWRGMLQSQLMPQYAAPGRRPDVIRYESPVPEDEEAERAERDSRVANAVALISAGFDAASVVEALELPRELVWVKPEPPPAPAPPPAADPAQPAADPGEGGGGDGMAPEARTRAAVGARTRALLAAPVDRDPTPDEQHMTEVDRQWQEALAALLLTWGAISEAQRESLVAQVRQIVASGDLTALTRMTPPTAGAVEALTAAMLAMGAAAAEQLAAEGRAAGADVAAGDVPTGDLTTVATAVALLLAGGLADSAAREALRQVVPGADAQDVADAVAAHLAGLSDSTLSAELGGALSRAQNVGRAATAEAAAAAGWTAEYVASEVLDGNTCAECRKVDGKVWKDVGAVMDAYGSGGYRKCEGGARCRGTFVVRWRGV